MEDTTKTRFQVIDFAIFGAFLAISVGVGVYHALKSRRLQKEAEESGKDDVATAEFLMGGRQMPIVPVALSLLTTFLSGVTMLGTPAEIYQRGLLFWLYYLMGAFAFIISGVFFVPIFYKLKPISIYEYFEHRFDSRLLRQLAAAIFIINTLFYMAVVLYAPSVALNGVTNISVVLFIILVGFTCTLYTTIGGLKAVVWTDTLQAVFMYTGIGILIVKGVIDAGGLGRVFDIAADSGRVTALWQFDPNPAQHNSFWISIFGALSFWLSLYGLNQMAIQRYCSLPSLRHARIVVAITVPAFVVLGTMACFIGLVMLAYFYDCDPLAAKEIASKDQLVILFALRIFTVPGLPGLFLACLFCFTLSTISSGMNSMAAVMWEDFLKHHLGERFSDVQAAMLNKGLVVIFGIISTCMAFLVGPMGGILKAAISVMGALSGPLIGLFFFGVFVPKANKYGAFVALAIASSFTLWICLANFIVQPWAAYTLPMNNTCAAINASTTPLGYDPHYGDPSVFYLYRISSLLYPLIGICLVLIIGTIGSYAMPEREPPKPSQRERTFSLTYFGRGRPYDNDAFEADQQNGINEGVHKRQTTRI